MANKNINNLPTATGLNAGDKLEILQGGTNKQIDASLLGAVQSVTGPQVDDTDPFNPIVNPLGLIKIIDLNGDFFTDLATASAYVRDFIDTGLYTITNESFDNGVFYFTVPKATVLYYANPFMSDYISSGITTASFIDELGLIEFMYGNGNFIKNHGQHKTFNCTFTEFDFEEFDGIIEMNDLVEVASFSTYEIGKNSTGKFIIKGNIGLTPSGNSYAGFFTGSTATILVNKEQYTINSGAIQGDLQTAILNGCNVQFEGINLATVNDLTRNNLGLYEMFITTGDQTTTSNIASNITGLVSQTLQANTRYYFEGIIMIGCNNTGGVKIQATLPALSTIAMNLEGASNSATGRTFSRLNASGALSSSNFGTVNSSNYYVKVAGEVSIGATPGTVQFDFASGTNLQTSTIYQLGTCINYKKLN